MRSAAKWFTLTAYDINGKLVLTKRVAVGAEAMAERKACKERIANGEFALVRMLTSNGSGIVMRAPPTKPS